MESQIWNLDAVRIFKQIGFDIIGLGGLYCLVVLLTWWRPILSRLAPVCVVIVIVGLCVNGVARFMARPLFSPQNTNSFDACLQRSATVVVLAGGQLQRKLPSISTALRMAEAFEYIKHANLKGLTLNIILSGGGDQKFYGTSESEVMRQYLSNHGLDKGHNVAIEDASLNTYENASLTKTILTKQSKDLNIALITGAVHMNRSRLTFVKQGFSVCAIAAPADELVGLGIGSFKDGERTIGVLNEYFGLLGYLWKGWI